MASSNTLTKAEMQALPAGKRVIFDDERLGPTYGTILSTDLSSEDNLRVVLFDNAYSAEVSPEQMKEMLDNYSADTEIDSFPHQALVDAFTRNPEDFSAYWVYSNLAADVPEDALKIVSAMSFKNLDIFYDLLGHTRVWTVFGLHKKRKGAKNFRNFDYKIQENASKVITTISWEELLKGRRSHNMHGGIPPLPETDSPSAVDTNVAAETAAASTGPTGAASSTVNTNVAEETATSSTTAPTASSSTTAPTAASSTPTAPTAAASSSTDNNTNVAPETAAASTAPTVGAPVADGTDSQHPAEQKQSIETSGGFNGEIFNFAAEAMKATLKDFMKKQEEKMQEFLIKQEQAGNQKRPANDNKTSKVELFLGAAKKMKIEEEGSAEYEAPWYDAPPPAAGTRRRSTAASTGAVAAGLGASTSAAGSTSAAAPAPAVRGDSNASMGGITLDALMGKIDSMQATIVGLQKSPPAANAPPTAASTPQPMYGAHQVGFASYPLRGGYDADKPDFVPTQDMLVKVNSHRRKDVWSVLRLIMPYPLPPGREHGKDEYRYAWCPICSQKISYNNRDTKKCVKHFENRHPDLVTENPRIQNKQAMNAVFSLLNNGHFPHHQPPPPPPPAPQNPPGPYYFGGGQYYPFR